MSDQLHLEILKLVGGGRALAHHDNKTWMVAGALPGETVSAARSNARAGVVEAHTEAVIAQPHPAREADPCPHAPDCGGCDWPHVNPERGAVLKTAAAAEAARGHRDLAARLAEAAIRTSPPAYRLRARLHWDAKTSTLGFFRGRSHEAIAIPSCRILSPRLIQALPVMEHALAASCPTRVDVEWLEDLDGSSAVAALRSVHETTLDLGPEHVPPASALGSLVDGFHLLGDAGRVHDVWGAREVRMDLPIPLSVPIGAFFQVNRHLVPWLFQRVGELVGAEPIPTWDLHAGVGFLAAAAHHAGKRRLALAEPFRPAAQAAEHNLATAKVAKGRSAESFLARRGRLPKKALVLTDPPRAGMSTELRRRIAGWHPDRLLMMACDPATWARDADFFLERGYGLRHLELVDLFPSTHHVEVLAMLESE